jgi:hypothetical protein
MPSEVVTLSQVTAQRPRPDVPCDRYRLAVRTNPPARMVRPRLLFILARAGSTVMGAAVIWSRQRDHRSGFVAKPADHDDTQRVKRGGSRIGSLVTPRVRRPGGH